MVFFLFLVVLLPCVIFGVPEVMENGRECPMANSSDYASFPYYEELDTVEFRTEFLKISVVEQNGTVSKEYNMSQPFSFGTIPMAQYLAGLTEPIHGSKEVVLDLGKLVSGVEAGIFGGTTRKLLCDCELKNSTTLPNIVIKLGNVEESADLVLTPFDYVLQHARIGYCYFAFYYSLDRDYFSSTDYQARQFCTVVDTEAKTVGFARPLA